MNVTLHIIPARNAARGDLSYRLSLAEARGGASASSHFPTLGRLTDALRSVGFDEPSIRFAEKTLKTGLTYTRPGVELADRHLRKLGIQQMEREAQRGRER
jgi:hypothetical protein